MVVCLCECVSLAYNQVSQFSAVTQSFPTLSDPVDGSTPGLSVLHYLPELAQAHLHRVGDASQPSHPVLAPSLALSLSRHQALFSSESALHIRWPKYCIFSFSINPSNEYSRLISFRIDWFNLFAVQGILKSLLQHHSSKASILWCSASSVVQLSHSWRRKWQPTHGPRSLVGYSSWGRKESDMTERRYLTSIHDSWKNHGFD